MLPIAPNPAKLEKERKVNYKYALADQAELTFQEHDLAPHDLETWSLSLQALKGL